MANQGYLFDDMETYSRKKGKTNAEFYDYESFVKKFTENPKTTDDCYTPPAVYAEILNYVNSIYNLKGKKIIRPFYPGGDYESCEYPDDGVVIDNPPFSILSRIIKFYAAHSVPFFLFSPALTCTQNAEICTVVIADAEITYENKAVVKTNFVTNLLPADILLITAPTLRKSLERAQETRKAHHAKHVYPGNVLSVSDMHKLVDAGLHFEVKRSEAKIIVHLDGLPKKTVRKASAHLRPESEGTCGGKTESERTGKERDSHRAVRKGKRHNQRITGRGRAKQPARRARIGAGGHFGYWAGTMSSR